MALSANTPRVYDLGNINEFGVLADATIYEGSAVGLSSGYARALTAGDIFVGYALEGKAEADSTNGSINIRVQSSGKIQATITSVAVTDVGKPVYMSDDGTWTLTQGSSSYVGKVHRYVTTNTAIVEFDAAASGNVINKVYSTITLPVTQAEITDGDVVTAFTPGFAGEIEKVVWIQNSAVTTADDASTLNLEIGTTNVTGGAISLTSAACTPIGAVIAGTAITAANTFTATDTISVEGSSTTAFAEGTGSVVITVSQAIV